MTTREEINSYLQKKKSTIRVSSYVQFAICEVPMQHAPIHNSDIQLHKVDYVLLVKTKKIETFLGFFVINCVEVLPRMRYILAIALLSRLSLNSVSLTSEQAMVFFIGLELQLLRQWNIVSYFFSSVDKSKTRFFPSFSLAFPS